MNLFLTSVSLQYHCCHRHFAVRREFKYKQRRRKVKWLWPSFANSHGHDEQHTLPHM